MAENQEAGSGSSRSGRIYRAAVCQFEPVFLNKAANLDKMDDLARRAVLAGAGLIIFPECCVTGYGLGEATAEMAGAAETVLGPERGPSVRRLEALADELGVRIIFGLAERTESGVYNSAVFAAPGRGVVGVHHKAHMWECEGEVFSPGDGFQVYEAPAGGVGALICFDLEFPEAGRLLALGGAHLLAVCTANMRPWEEFQRVYARARAMENSVYVAVANCLGYLGGTDFFGGSLIVDPLGRVLTEAGRGEAVLTAEIDLDLIDRARAETNYFKKRRPDLYLALSRSSG